MRSQAAKTYSGITRTHFFQIPDFEDFTKCLTVLPINLVLTERQRELFHQNPYLVQLLIVQETRVSRPSLWEKPSWTWFRWIRIYVLLLGF